MSLFHEFVFMIGTSNLDDVVVVSKRFINRN